MNEATVVIFLVAFGFVVAAIIFSIRQWVSAIRGDESGTFWLRVTVWNVIYCMFAGPYMLVSRISHVYENRELGLTLVASGLLLAILWSFCSGILVVQALAAAGIVTI